MFKYILILFILFSCGGNDNEAPAPEGNLNTQELNKAVDDKFQGFSAPKLFANRPPQHITLKFQYRFENKLLDLDYNTGEVYDEDNQLVGSVKCTKRSSPCPSYRLKFSVNYPEAYTGNRLNKINPITITKNIIFKMGKIEDVLRKIKSQKKNIASINLNYQFIEFYNKKETKLLNRTLFINGNANGKKTSKPLKFRVTNQIPGLVEDSCFGEVEANLNLVTNNKFKINKRYGQRPGVLAPFIDGQLFSVPQELTNILDPNFKKAELINNSKVLYFELIPSKFFKKLNKNCSTAFLTDLI